jgi:hypothetical protein
VILFVLFAALGCDSEGGQERGFLQGSYTLEETPPSNEVTYVTGETLYVPIYSSIFSLSSSRTYDLTATLSIHNIDLTNSIKVTKADYYNTSGQLIKSYVEKALILKPLQTLQLVIKENDTSGGTGANFIVDWVSESEASSPIVEAVMISTKAQQGISFTTTGKVIRTIAKQ